jgi:hypothetical protein
MRGSGARSPPSPIPTKDQHDQEAAIEKLADPATRIARTFTAFTRLRDPELADWIAGHLRDRRVGQSREGSRDHVRLTNQPIASRWRMRTRASGGPGSGR